jgi:hypothetical protein
MVVDCDASADSVSQPESKMSEDGDFLPRTKLSKSISPLGGLLTPFERPGAAKVVRSLARAAPTGPLAERSCSLRVCSSSMRPERDLIRVMND